MKNREVLEKQEQLLMEVDFLANKFSQNESENAKECRTSYENVSHSIS